MSLRNIAILLILATSLNVFAQNDSLVVLKGDVQVTVDSAIVRLERGSRGFKEIKGYRVQIFLGTLEEVKEERNKYLSLGLPYSAYVKQIVPEHALQIGDFATRMELDKCLSELEDYYKSTIPVVTFIEPPKVKDMPKSFYDRKADKN
ncbi:MAG: hypothetical protein ACKOZM_09800 [Flavobacteriales bacterium]